MTVRNSLSIDDQTYHDFICLESVTEQYMAYQPFMLHFIVCRILNSSMKSRIQFRISSLTSTPSAQSVFSIMLCVLPHRIQRSLCRLYLFRSGTAPYSVAERLHSFSVHPDSRMHDLIQKFTRTSPIRSRLPRTLDSLNASCADTSSPGSDSRRIFLPSDRPLFHTVF